MCNSLNMVIGILEKVWSYKTMLHLVITGGRWNAIEATNRHKTISNLVHLELDVMIIKKASFWSYLTDYDILHVRWPSIMATAYLCIPWYVMFLDRPIIGMDICSVQCDNSRSPFARRSSTVWIRRCVRIDAFCGIDGYKRVWLATCHDCLLAFEMTTWSNDDCQTSLLLDLQ